MTGYTLRCLTTEPCNRLKAVVWCWAVQQTVYIAWSTNLMNIVDVFDISLIEIYEFVIVESKCHHYMERWLCTGKFQSRGLSRLWYIQPGSRMYIRRRWQRPKYDLVGVHGKNGRTHDGNIISGTEMQRNNNTGHSRFSNFFHSRFTVQQMTELINARRVRRNTWLA